MVSELLNAESLYFNHKPVSQALCPKTLQLESLVQSHDAVTIHAVSAWLEKIYEQSNGLNSTTELDCLKSMFEMIRAGQIQQVQEELLKSNQVEKFLWLIGSEPHFDNIEFE